MRYVLNKYERGRSLDHHWMTLNNLCHVCDLDYDYIVKVETMSTDAEWLLPTLLKNDVGTTTAAMYKSLKHKTEIIRPTIRHHIPTLNAGLCTMSFLICMCDHLALYCVLQYIG